ncbi:MAG TPA: hypothetical protein VGD78_07805 [Chthoniobacterales bacterium]
MVIEMVVLSVAPAGGGTLLFLLCLANRLVSGIAEGLASGADEALVFDSLAESGRSEEWPQVLDQVTRCQSVGMVVAMLVGGAIYDPGFINAIAGALRFPVGLTQGTTLRFPVYLNLVTAALTLVVALSMREPGRNSTRTTPVADDRPAGRQLRSDLGGPCSARLPCLAGRARDGAAGLASRKLRLRGRCYADGPRWTGAALALAVLGVFFRRHAPLLRQPGAVASDPSKSRP